MLRKCLMDKVEYDYCPHCGNKNETWRVSFCCESCRDLYGLFINRNSTPIAEAKNIIKNIKINDVTKYHIDVQKYLESLKDEPVIEAKPVEEKPLMEEFRFTKKKNRKPIVNDDLNLENKTTTED